jgi:hypothetical protein
VGLQVAGGWPTLARGPSRLFDNFQLVHVPFEQFVAGGLLQQLMRTVGPAGESARFALKAPPDDVLARAMDAGVEIGLESSAPGL